MKRNRELPGTFHFTGQKDKSIFPQTSKKICREIKLSKNMSLCSIGSNLTNLIHYSGDFVNLGSST